MEWKITKSSGQCSACHSELSAGEAFYSLLNETGEGLERRDYCPECWEKAAAERSDAIFFWRTTRAERQSKKRAIDLETVTGLFRKLADGDGTTHRKIRYFLALLLMRKKIVKLLGTGHEDGVEYMTVRLKGEEESRRVANPELDKGDMEDVKAELEAMLQMELSG